MHSTVKLGHVGFWGSNQGARGAEAPIFFFFNFFNLGCKKVEIFKENSQLLQLNSHSVNLWIWGHASTENEDSTF